jgi:hypothetical protein
LTRGHFLRAFVLYVKGPSEDAYSEA